MTRPCGIKFVHPVRGKLVNVGRSHLSHARQARLEAHENEAHEEFLLERDEAMPFEIEIAKRLAVRNPDKSAIQRIRPPVIGAGDASAAMTLLSVEQTRRAVSAHVVKAADPSIAVPH